ncbi:MAG: lipopolysaccharide biosynthesis protein [Pseudomonadota bacterium]
MAVLSRAAKIWGHLQDDRIVNQLLSKGVSALAIKVATAGLTFVLFVCLARWLGPEEYGRYATWFSLGNFLGFVVVGGVHTLALRQIPALISNKQHGAALGLMRDGYLALGLLGAVLLAICATAGLFGEALGYFWWAPLIAAGLALPFAVAEFQSNALRGWGSVNLALLPRDVIWRLSLVALLAWLVSTGVQVTATEAFAWTCIVLLALNIAQFVLGQRVALTKDGWAAAQEHPPAPISALVDARWLALAAIVTVLLTQLSVVVVSAVLNVVDAGVFFAAQRTSALLSLPLVAANMIGAPMIAKAWAEDDKASIQRICALIALGLTLPTLAGWLLFAMEGAWIMALFDPSFSEYGGLLMILASGAVVNAFCGPTGVFMLMTGHERSHVLILATVNIVGLFCVAILSTYDGLSGAVVASALTIVVWNVTVALWIKVKYGIDTTILHLGTLLLRRLKGDQR